MSERGFKRIARRRYNDLDILGQTVSWGIMIGMEFSFWSFVLAFLCWVACAALSVELESIYFPEYSKSPTPSTPHKTGV